MHNSSLSTCTSMALLLTGTVSAADASDRNLCRNGDFADGLTGWTLTAPSLRRTNIVPAQAGPYRKALHLELQPPAGGKSWSIVMHTALAGFIGKGHRLALKAWMRSPQSLQVLGFLEVPKPPWAKSIGRTVSLSPRWREVTFSGQAVADYGPGEATLGFHLGYGKGVIEIAGVRLFDLDAPAGGPARPSLDKPESLIANGDFGGPLKTHWRWFPDDRVEAKRAGPGPDGLAQCVRLEVKPAPGADPWSIQFAQGCRGLVLPKEVVRFRAWVRSSQRARVAFVVEEAKAPYRKSIFQMVRLGPEWKSVVFAGVAERTFKPGELQAKLFLGYDPGTVEIAGVRVENVGMTPLDRIEQTIDYWGGRKPSDAWRAAAQERIERIRKGELVVRVMDAAGRPAPGAAVTVRQRRHFFRFGTCVPAARLVDRDNPDNVRFQREVERLYNTVTFENDLKWRMMSPQRLATVAKALAWLEARHIAVRGHCLLWGAYRHLPPSTGKLRGRALLEACRAHVLDYAGRMRGKVYVWDVVNEAATNVELWNEIGWKNFPESFRWTRSADPNVLLSYNDYGIVDDTRPRQRAKVRERIQYLLDNGAPLDVLGVQAHMRVPLTPIRRVLEILDEWAAFGKSIEITEFDLGCRNDRVHAAYVRDFMTAVFSHPKVTAFIMWGFWKGSHWRGNEGGAMFRRDWSKRPAQTAWEDLVFRQWWTNWTGRTGSDGRAAVRAFYGTYDVRAEVAGKTAHGAVRLEPGAEGRAEVVLRLGR
ncbi:MAG: hypothetical protein GXP31_03585 [Kiritimatiellaeota bacterium]|nr:hypothetical protein [Kiritimatiellota bacterium]